MVNFTHHQLQSNKPIVTFNTLKFLSCHVPKFVCYWAGWPTSLFDTCIFFPHRWELGNIKRVVLFLIFFLVRRVWHPSWCSECLTLNNPGYNWEVSKAWSKVIVDNNRTYAKHKPFVLNSNILTTCIQLLDFNFLFIFFNNNKIDTLFILIFIKILFI